MTIQEYNTRIFAHGKTLVRPFALQTLENGIKILIGGDDENDIIRQKAYEKATKTTKLLYGDYKDYIPWIKIELYAADGTLTKTIRPEDIPEYLLPR